MLLHQTCANILAEELGRHEEAFKHREIAVRLDPKSWTYQGMGNTLTHLKRYAEADTNYTHSVEMAPGDATYLHSWAWSMRQRGDFAKEYAILKRIRDLDRDDPDVWEKLSVCAMKLKLYDEGVKCRQMAEALNKKLAK